MPYCAITKASASKDFNYYFYLLFLRNKKKRFLMRKKNESFGSSNEK